MSQNPVIGELQLAAWQELARTWPVYLDEQEHFRCKECNVTIWRLNDDNGQGYIYTAEELLALKVAHIRQSHGNLEAEVYERAGLNHERNTPDV